MKLGDCLVFYLKYFPEMTKLHREEVDVPSLPEPVDTKEKASRVGKKADEEAAAFLDECGKHIVDYFSQIGNPNITANSRIERKSECEKTWSTSYAVWPRANRRRGVDKMTVGVSFLGMVSRNPEIVTWIWRIGADAQQQALLHYLTIAGKAKGAWKDTELVEGAVALGRAPIVLPTDGFELDAHQLLVNVKEAIQRIDQEDLNHLFP